MMGLILLKIMALALTTPTHSSAGYPSNLFQRIAQSKIGVTVDQGGFAEPHE